MSTSSSIDPNVQYVQQLFIAHATQLRSLIFVLLPHRGITMDVLQETFLTVTEKAHSFEKGTNFVAWAGAIAKFKVMEARRRIAMPLLSVDTIDALYSSPMAVPPDSRIDLLRECVAALPDNTKRMVDLYYIESQKPAAIARAIGWTVESVYVALSRARTMLRKCVEQKLAAGEG